MDSSELECIIYKNARLISKYGGKIYSYDNLPNRLIENKFYIVNDKSSKSDFSIPGHWITLLYYGDHHTTPNTPNTPNTPSTSFLAYIDSFGLPLEPQFIQPLLQRVQCPILYMNYPLQNINTTSCGLHSLTFCSFFSYDWSVLEILENYYDIYNPKSKLDPYFFDRKAQSFILKFFHEKRSIFYEP